MKFRYMIIWVKTCQKTEVNLLPGTMIIDKQQKILTNILWPGIKLFGWIPLLQAFKNQFRIVFKIEVAQWCSE